MKKVLFICWIISCAHRSFATGQSPDLLIIKGDTIRLSEFPLEYLDLQYHPFGHTRQTAPSSACWRGYQAIWRIIDGQIYLEKILRCNADQGLDREERIAELFSKNNLQYEIVNGLIWADWITMDLYTTNDQPSSKDDRKGLMNSWFGKNKQQERILLFQIRNGKVVSNND